jgi:hypothetical protein
VASLDAALGCLGYGARSAARFGDDLDRARDLAADQPAPVAAPDSAEAGMVATRAAHIHGANWGCDCCGGMTYVEPMPIDREARILAPGEIGAPFEASVDGAHWDVVFPYAGCDPPTTLRRGASAGTKLGRWWCWLVGESLSPRSTASVPVRPV